MTITFNNGSFDLIIANGQVKLGDQVLSTTPTVLDDLGASNAAASAALSMAVFDAGPEPALSSNLLYLG